MDVSREELQAPAGKLRSVERKRRSQRAVPAAAKHGDLEHLRSETHALSVLDLARGCWRSLALRPPFPLSTSTAEEGFHFSGLWIYVPGP